MPNQLAVPMFDLVLCLSQAVDLVSPAVADHHKRVAYIAFRIATELGLPLEECKTLAIAGAVHDIGGLSLHDRLDALRFEVERPHEHANIGYRLLRTFLPFANVADIVRFHHVPWHHGAGTEYAEHVVSMTSHLVHLADRISVLINPQEYILAQVEQITARIVEQSNEMFAPQLVDAFRALAAREYFWLDIVSPTLDTELKHISSWDDITLNDEDFFSLTNMFRRIIDFKSPFTMVHSSGVAESAATLAAFAQFDETNCRLMRIAGHLHDLGKLAVPAELLNKPDRLTKDEVNVMRRHAYFTDRILEPIDALAQVRKWGSLHHERLDGTGYPFHLKLEDIPLGSRIMSVADVFVALTENRPYRTGMQRTDAMAVLERMVSNSALDVEIVSLLGSHFDEVNEVRTQVQVQATEEYQACILSTTNNAPC